MVEKHLVLGKDMIATESGGLTRREIEGPSRIFGYLSSMSSP